MLEKGDYILSDQCAVERKTVNDFVYTLTRRYLFEQLFRLKDVYPKSLIVLEGYLPIIYKYSSISPASIWGAMFNFAKNGIAIVNTSNQKETVDFLYTAARQEQIVEKRSAVVHALRNVIPSRMRRCILLRVCQVLAVRRQRRFWILTRLRLMRLINVDDWEKAVHGLGPVITNRVKDVINYAVQREYAGRGRKEGKLRTRKVDLRAFVAQRVGSTYSEADPEPLYVLANPNRLTAAHTSRDTCRRGK